MLVSNCKSQSPIKWKKSKNWKFYDLRSSNGFKIDIATLEKGKNIPVDSLRIFLNGTKILETTSPVWQDFFITTTEVEGKIRKVIFSVYGGFNIGIELKGISSKN